MSETMEFAPVVDVDGETFPIEYAATSGQIAHVRFREEERLTFERADDGRISKATRHRGFAPLPPVVA